ncbi:MAG: DUF2062 domain-containing protein [Alphaproteobacteria bacterium]|jgi:hypothetical protein|nr:DUF2062 domain-containing protein [Alphaproteobacteria bacterium]MDP7642159.1 DUF2062 domain-containing protein [Alphaproteobacteria bacterium]
MSVFRRRRKRQLLARLLEFVWPRMGWRRAGRYYVFRIKRLPGTPYTIACGFALGAAVSFTPFIGLHFVLAGLLAWVLRANLLASAIGTAVGNPWTFPGIWFGVLWLGSKILGRDMPELSLSDLSLTMIFDHFSTIGVPMIVGGIPAGLVVWVIFYIPIRRAIANYQHHRHTSRTKRQQVLAEQRREREMGVANINTEEEPGGAAETAVETADELTIPEPGKAQEERPSATVTPINRAAGEGKRG